MFAASDSLITLLIFAAIAIISHWLRRRRKGQQPEEMGEEVPPPMRERGGQPPARPANWEEELRRLLQGESQPAPPPVVRTPPSQPKPPPIPKAPRPLRPAVVSTVKRGAEAAGTPVTGAIQAYLQGRGLSRAAGQAARSRARQIDRQAAAPARLRPATGSTSAGASAGRVLVVAPEVAHVRAMLQDRRSARSAILATVILGPPKANEA